MEIYRIYNNIKKKTRFRNPSNRKAGRAEISALTTNVDGFFFQDKNISISGEFFPMSQKVFEDNLEKRGANVQPEMTLGTEILICGKYPNWIQVEEARSNGVKIIFVDRAGELFGSMGTNLVESRFFSSNEEPLGV